MLGRLSAASAISILPLSVCCVVYLFLFVRINQCEVFLVLFDPMSVKEGAKPPLPLFVEFPSPANSDAEGNEAGAFVVSKNATLSASSSFLRRTSVFPQGRINVIFFMHIYKTGGTTSE